MLLNTNILYVLKKKLNMAQNIFFFNVLKVKAQILK